MRPIDSTVTYDVERRARPPSISIDQLGAWPSTTSSRSIDRTRSSPSDRRAASTSLRVRSRPLRWRLRDQRTPRWRTGWNARSSTCGSSPGTEAEYDKPATRPSGPSSPTRSARAGLRNMSGFRRGTDVWYYVEARALTRRPPSTSTGPSRRTRSGAATSATSSPRSPIPRAASSGTTRSSTPVATRCRARWSAR